MTRRSITNEIICGQTIILTGPLTEEQLFLVLEEIQEIRDNRNICRFLDEVWGDVGGMASFTLAAPAGSEEESRTFLTVFDARNQLRLPDLRLPFWQAHLNAAASLKKELEQCESDEARLEVLNHFLSTRRFLQEYGLPDPSSQHPAFQRKILLSTLSVTYPALYELDHVQVWERPRHESPPRAKEERATNAIVLFA